MCIMVLLGNDNTAGMGIEGNWHTVVFDQYFTSPILLLLLQLRGVYAVGTCQTNRRGFPKRLLMAILLAGGWVMGAASFLFMHAYRMVACRWRDKKDVWFLSTRHYCSTMAGYMKRMKGHVDEVASTMPTLRDYYNQNNNGVDIRDQMNSAYILDRQSKATIWHRVHQHWCALSVCQAQQHYKMVKQHYTAVCTEEVESYLTSGYYRPERRRRE
jgi:hypothetical protein